MATSFSCGGCFCFSFAFFSLYLFLLLLLLHLNRSLIGYFTLTEHKHSNAQMESVYYSLATIVFAKDCVRARSLFLFPSTPPPQTLQKVEKAHALRGIFRLIVPKVEESAFFTLWQASNLVEC